MNKQTILAAMAFILTCCTSSTLSAFTPNEERASRETYFENILLLDTSNRYFPNINFGYVGNDTKPGSGLYFCGGITSQQALQASRVITETLAYLRDIPANSLNLKYIILCSRATASGEHLNAAPVPDLNMLIMNIDRLDVNPAYIQHTFLHEYYHLAEYKFDRYQDTEWRKQFGTGYSNTRSGYNYMSRPGTGKPGFLNIYSESYDFEERAELFSYALQAPAEIVNYINSSNDLILREKTEYLVEKCKTMLGLRISLIGL